MDPVLPTSDSSAAVMPVAASPASMAALAKLSLADKIIAGAAVLGVVSTFLTALSVSANMTGTMETISSMSVIGDWRGKLGFLCFVAAGVLVFLIMRKGVTASKPLLYALLVACALPPVLAILLLLGLSSATSGATAEDSIKVSTGVGCYLFLICGLGTAVGGFLKARDAKLLPAAVSSLGTRA